MLILYKYYAILTKRFMLKKQAKSTQNDLYNQKLENLINLKHPMCILSEKIPWEVLEKEFEQYYRLDFGRPAKPIRLMVSILLLKQMYNESDESVVVRWQENPYWQYFSGEEYFQWKLPCDDSELTRFRQRIGESGLEKIFELSIKLHGKEAMEVEVVPDTTVQEKNITFPTDTKLHLKIIKECCAIAEGNGVVLRQSYKRTVKRLRWNTRYLNTPRRAKEGRKAVKKLKIIAGRLLREITRKLSEEILQKYQSKIGIMRKVLGQKRDSKNKIYSLHEPDVSCIAKGKEHKKYEFGSKVSILVTKNSGIIVGAKNFQGNPYDGNTLESALEQAERLRGIKSEKAIVDEGYRGRLMIGETEVIRAHQPKKKKYSKYKWRKWFKRRASVEAIISHLKNDHRLSRNYLKGVPGDAMNLLLSAAAFNFRKLMIKLASFCHFLKFVFYVLFVRSFLLQFEN
jgi:IS5 family transposase